MEPSSHDKPGIVWQPLYGAWLLSLVAILGTLFFSEVMKLPPCSLCWYQRVAMYPLGIILTVGLWSRDPRVTRYAWPFVLFGLGVAAYHNLLYYQIIPESLAPCTEGVPCSSRQIEWLGFITIPLLSLVCFSMVAGLLFEFSRRLKGVIR